jgi:c-di-GMP-binding flagellar brake protein YcgR
VPCVIPVSDAENPDLNGIIELTLIDISLGGIGAIAADPLDELLVVGASFDKCKISFPEVGETSLTLQVRNITPIVPKEGVVNHRIGFQFITPSRGNEGLINSYTHNLERQAIAVASKL